MNILSRLEMIESNQGLAASLDLLTHLILSNDMTEESGTREDSYENELDLTDVNTVTSMTGPDGVTVAALFNPANSEYLAHEYNSLYEIANNDWTLNVFYYLENAPAVQDPIYSIYFGSPGHRAIVDSSRNVSFVARNAANDATATATSTDTITLDTWTMVTLQHDATNDVIKVKINLGDWVTAAITDGVYTNGEDEFRVGRVTAGDNYYHDGGMSRLRIWRSAAGEGGLLTDAQITALYNSGASLPFASFT